MKHSSIEKMNLNIAPVQIVVEKEFLTDEQDIWTIKMVSYDYQAIRSKIDAQMEIIFDKAKLMFQKHGSNQRQLNRSRSCSKRRWNSTLLAISQSNISKQVISKQNKREGIQLPSLKGESK